MDKKLTGFSLVEMMVAIFILVIVMCTLIVSFSQIQAMGKKTEMVMTAANLAQQRMEIAMRETFETLDTLTESLQYIDRYGKVSESNTDFKRETIINEDYSGDSSLTQVMVRVYYKAYGYRVGKAADLTLTGELVEKDWSTSPIELVTIMVNN